MKVFVFGASMNPQRYSNIATKMLLEYNHELVLLGLREGTIHGVDIITGHPSVEGIDTITMYVGAARQAEHIDYLIGLKPKRIIFNPGTENMEFESKVRDAGIISIRACTLVLLRTNQFDLIEDFTK